MLTLMNVKLIMENVSKFVKTPMVHIIALVNMGMN